MRVGALLQVRSGSSRLPNKALLRLPFGGKHNVLQHIARRLEATRQVEALVVATTTLPEDDVIAALFPDNHFRGDEDNVLRRFYLAAKAHRMEHVIRLTGDNPCLDPALIDEALEEHLAHKADYTKTLGLPLGTNLEIIAFRALECAYLEASDPQELEHVTPFIRRRGERFRLVQLHKESPKALQGLRLTLDYPSDYAMLNIIFGHFGDRVFGLQELERFVTSHPWLKDVNPNAQKYALTNTAEELDAALELLETLDLHRAARLLRRTQPTHQREESHE